VATILAPPQTPLGELTGGLLLKEGRGEERGESCFLVLREWTALSKGVQPVPKAA